jgi:LAO/AO transport system kinase
VLEGLAECFRRGDRRALARLLSLAARGEHLDEVRALVGRPAKPALAVAVTGSAGVGKSTLVGRLIDHIRAQGQTVAVLACDPQSPLSGGALLGDRFRMPSRPDDDGVFIRSLAAAGGQGAVARHVGAMVQLLEAFGFDVVLIETVGAGQGDTAVRDLADVVLLLVQPETGDDLQWEKAGVLEVADVIAVHKADLPGADRVEAQLRAVLDPAGDRRVAILRVSAKTGEWIDRLWETVRALPRRRGEDRAAARELFRLAQELLASRFAAAEADSQLTDLAIRWRQGGLGDAEAAAALARLLLAAPPTGV